MPIKVNSWKYFQKYSIMLLTWQQPNISKWMHFTVVSSSFVTLFSVMYNSKWAVGERQQIDRNNHCHIFLYYSNIAAAVVVVIIIIINHTWVFKPAIIMISMLESLEMHSIIDAILRQQNTGNDQLWHRAAQTLWTVINFSSYGQSQMSPKLITSMLIITPCSKQVTSTFDQ